MRNKTVLVVDDESLVRWSIRQKLQSAEYQVLEAGTAAEAMALFKEHLPDMVTLDVRLPDSNGLKVLLEMKKISPTVPVVMITAYGVIDDAVKALQIGAYDYLEKPINFGRLLHSVSNALETSELRRTVEDNKREQKETYSIDRIIGESKVIKEVKALVLKVADSEARTILLQGESGTGKDLVAKALHYQSCRANKPFMVLNCAAVPEQLLENELFGHERGAFTDAKTMKKGLFELANGGTIFFDEISEMDLHLQSKLLRVLEEQTFRRIGGVKDVQTDTRVICASNQDLEKSVRDGHFRDDLFYRLSVIPITLPPLRARDGDIQLLVLHFVKEFNLRFRKSIKGVVPEAMEILTSYHWPGNVRELKNAIERALILQDDGYIEPDLLPLRLLESQDQSHRLGNGRFSLSLQGIDLYEVEKELVQQALVKAGGNQTKASRLLSITRDTLRYKMKKYGLAKKLKSSSTAHLG
ncbi:MAG: sigma-54-dependent transcriptional regulator [Acidobacteriota bacterium]